MRIRHLWPVAKQAVSSWVDDHAASMGAALAYYTAFSLAPLLLIVVAIAGMVFGPDAARGEIYGQLRGLMGDQAAQAVQALLQSANRLQESKAATAIGAVLLLIGATSVFGELQGDLDRIWHAPARKRQSGIWEMLRTRLLSFGLILGLGFLMIVSLIFSAAVSVLSEWWNPIFAGWGVLAHAVNFIISFGLTTAMFAMIYKIMPSVKIDWQDVWVGSAVTALLFTIGKTLIALYLGKSSVASPFGAAGSLAVVLVWVYYSAQIFLLGAEFTWAYAHRYGSRSGDSPTGKPPVAQGV
jgi:membrane protein